MGKLSKRQKALTRIDPTKYYGVDEAIATVKANATAKFDETIEVALNLGVDPRHADQMVRGVVTLPAPARTVRVAVFAKGDKADEAKAAGADVVGAEDLMETIQGGTIDFDRVIATPGHDGRGRPARQGARPQGPDAEPEARHGDDERRRGGQGRQGRPGRVPRREGRDHPCRDRQGELHREPTSRRISTRSSTRSSRPSRRAPRANMSRRAAISSSMGPGVKIDLEGGGGVKHPPLPGWGKGGRRGSTRRTWFSAW